MDDGLGRLTDGAKASLEGVESHRIKSITYGFVSGQYLTVHQKQEGCFGLSLDPAPGDREGKGILMIDQISHQVPTDHPIRSLFRTLTERGMAHINIRDDISITYISSLLAEFLPGENLYRFRDKRGRRLEYLADLLAAADQTADPVDRMDRHKHLGDLTLFMLGLFPERFDRVHRSVSAGYSAEQGRKSYNIVADLAWIQSEPAPFRQLADRFEYYVRGLNWVKVYTQDPFSQYMFREFGVA